MISSKNSTTSTTSGRFGALCGAAVVACAPLAQAAVAPGDYLGTLACGPTLAGPPEAAFTGSAAIKVEGNTVTWIRETQAMREVVSGHIVDGKVALEGYGGSVSAATRQAFWDWKLAGQLIYADGRFTGAAQLLSKDGRVLQRRCTVVSLPSTAAVVPDGSNPGSQSASSPAPGPAPEAPKATAPANAPAAASEPSAPPMGATQPTGQADRAAPHEAQLSHREEALSRREQAVARRERALVQQQKKVAPAVPSAPAKPPASGTQPSVRTPSAAPALGDI